MSIANKPVASVDGLGDNPKPIPKNKAVSQKINKKLPWNKTENKKDAFFSGINLQPDRVNGLYPYRLLVIDVTDSNKIVSNSSGSFDADEEVVKNASNTGGVSYTIIGGLNNAWAFTLPITPQQLSVTDQFAINTTATMRGVVEEHNGVKFKMISASGTTGIWPTRSKEEFPDSTIGKGLSLFGGTIEAFGTAKESFSNLFNGGKNAPITRQPAEDNDGQNTGYFQALLLQQFLEQYAMAKKNPENKGWRLVFDCPKTNESFIVTPLQYVVTKSQRSPGEHLYNMQFKAWKRVQVGGTPKDKKAGRKPKALDSNFFQNIVSSLDRARSAMSSAFNVVRAVRADVAQVFDQVRKVTLLAKDLGGLVISVGDLPSKIGKDITSATKKRSLDLDSDIIRNGKRDRDFSRKSEKKILKIVSQIRASNSNNEGLTSEQVNDGLLGEDAKDLNNTSELNDVFNQPEANFDFFSLINTGDLDLTPEQRGAIQDEIELNSLLSIEEVKEIKREVQNLILDLTNSFGAGDEFFSEVFGRPAPRKRPIPMTLEEFELITKLEEAVLNLNIFTATRELDDSRKQSPLEYVGGLADDSAITFNSDSTAKILAPVPFGLTMQQISARYLGDPDRYNEIITLNNLKSPYIDEDGFSYDFLTNGDGRQFNINTNKNLYEGQKIRLFSNTIPVFTRKITAIEKITDTNFLITVDGKDDEENTLTRLKASEGAKIKAFLPGTVNSQNQIYIPSNEAVTEEAKTFDIPFLKEDTLTGISKIDWLLDDSGDIVLNSFGEASLANGTTNLIQALKMKVTTQKGSLLSNPTFGLSLTPGINVTDAEIGNILKDLRDMVLQDSRFDAIENIEINILPPDVSISINARLANGRGIFPINFTV